MQRFLVIIGIGLLVIGFQNCQEAKISASDDALSKAQLMAVTADDPEDAEGQVAQDGGDVVTPAPAPAPAPAPSPGNSGCKANCVSENPPGSGGGSPSVDAGDGNVCILEGPGKSVKLGQNAAAVPGGQHPIPSVLCMSANACLNIASKAFSVKGPEFRGYCKLPHGNPHVFHVTDAQLQIKIDAFLKK